MGIRYDSISASLEQTRQESDSQPVKREPSVPPSPGKVDPESEG
jgi:hypothetical protein